MYHHVTKHLKVLDDSTGRHFKKHVRTWRDCTKCPIGEHAFNHVTGRGSLPADVLFVGEAPGVSEDMIGYPFVGASGQLLDAAIKVAEDKLVRLVPYFITNTVLCRPFGTRNENRRPSEEEIHNCSGRFMEMHSIVKPKMLICLGRVAEEAVDVIRKEKPEAFPLVKKLRHPAYVLRMGGIKGREFKRFCKDLTNILRSIQ